MLRPYAVRTPDEERERLRTRFRQRKALVAEIKEASPCVDCGEYYPYCAMDFDHVRGEKVGCVSALAAGDWDTVLREIAKCDLVCANCHRIRTFKRREEAAQAQDVCGNDDKRASVELQITFDIPA